MKKTILLFILALIVFATVITFIFPKKQKLNESDIQILIEKGFNMPNLSCNTQYTNIDGSTKTVTFAKKSNIVKFKDVDSNFVNYIDTNTDTKYIIDNQNKTLFETNFNSNTIPKYSQVGYDIFTSIISKECIIQNVYSTKIDDKDVIAFDIISKQKNEKKYTVWMDTQNGLILKIKDLQSEEETMEHLGEIFTNNISIDTVTDQDMDISLPPGYTRKVLKT